MSAEIVDLAAHRSGDPAVAAPRVGNGGRAVVIEIALTLPAAATLGEAEMWADWLLMELWSRGFKVVPLE